MGRAVSNEALTWAFRQQAPSPGAKFVLVALADLANHEHKAWPPQAQLAAMTGQGVRTVQRHLDDLAEVELVTREHRNEAYSVRKSDVYTLPVSVVARTGARSTPVKMTPVKNDEDTRQAGGIKEPPSNPQLNTSRPEIEHLCSLLADLIESNGSKRPNITQGWRDACRLLIDRDGREPDKIERAIRWCQQDEFWRANVLSMPTLRKQYDRLRLAAQRSTNGQPRDLDAERTAVRVARRRGPLGSAVAG